MDTSLRLIPWKQKVDTSMSLILIDLLFLVDRFFKSPLQPTGYRTIQTLNKLPPGTHHTRYKKHDCGGHDHRRRGGGIPVE